MAYEHAHGTKVVVSAGLDREQREELERLAHEGDRTLSQQVRVAIREYLAATDEKAEEER